MKKIPLVVFITLMISAIPLTSGSEPLVSDESPGTEQPVLNPNVERDHFVENGGQLNRDDIRFYTLGPFRAGFTETSVVFAINDAENGTYSYEMVFSHARKVEPEGIDPEEGYYNYMVGEKERWASRLACYKKVVYKDLWEGIDLVYYIKGGSLKYDLVVQPGADPDSIGFDLIGIDCAYIDGNGDLMMRTPLGTVSDYDLVSYQGEDTIKADFEMKGNHLGFDLGEYDNSKTLVIDPLIQYCTYLGGSNYEQLLLKSVMSNGDLIMTGFTSSSDFPKTPGVIDRTYMGGEAFITRMKGNLGSLVFSTYLGGQYADYASGVDLDRDGNIYVSGNTESKDFPTTTGVLNETSKIGNVETPWGQTVTAPDIFVSKISSDGTNLIYSTYIAGNHTDYNQDIAVDDDGYAYVIASVRSPDLPIKNAYESEITGYYDYYIAKLNQNASSLEWSTYLGGEDDEWSSEGPTKVDISPSGDIYVAGNAESMDFPTTSGAYKQSTGSRWLTGTLTAFEDDGDLIFSTYIHEDTQVGSLEVTSDSVYLTGNTDMSNFPVTKDTAYDTALGGWSDAYLLEMDTQGSMVKYATFLGGDEYEFGWDISFDNEDRVILTGYTGSSDFPLSDYPVDDSFDGWSETFITIFNKDKDGLHFSTLFGGNDDDYGLWLGIADDGLYMAGYTSSSDLPVHDDAFDRTYSNGDLFVTRIKIYSFPPSRPRNLTADRGDENVTLTWSSPLKDGNETITGYNIYMSPLNRSFELVGTVDTGNSTFLHEGLDNGQRYYYYITAKNIVGESPPSNRIMAIPAKPPSVPEITGYSTGDGSVMIEWEDPEDLGGDVLITFNIYCGPSSEELELLESGINDFSYIHQGLQNGKIYYYSISASNGVGEGPPTSPIPLRPLKKPSDPLNLTAGRGSRYVHLYWDLPADDGGEENLKYNLYMSEDDSTFSLEKGNLAATEFNVTDLINGRSYKFMVKAFNEKGEGPPSLIIGSRPVGIPSEPRDPELEISNGKVHLTWEPPVNLGGDDAVTYNVYMAEEGMNEELIAKDIADEEFKMSGLENGKSYIFHVTASNAIFEGPISESVSGTSFGPPSVPEEINVSFEDSTIVVEWSPPTDDGGDPLISYRIYLGATETDLSEVAETSGLKHRESGLTNGRIYYVAVRAFNSHSMSSFSQIRTVIPLSMPGPPEIILLTPSDEQIKVAWKPPADLGGAEEINYNLYLAAEGDSLLLYKEVINSTGFTITGLDNGVEYTVEVSAVNSVGEGPRSDPARQKPMTSPSEPVSIELSPGKGWINISWTLPEDSGGSPFVDVEIYRWEEGGMPEMIRTVPAERGYYIDEQVKEGIEYNYMAVGITSVGKTPDSAVVSAKSQESEGEMNPLIPVTIAILVLLLILVIIVLLALRKDTRGIQQAQPYPQQLYYQQEGQLPQQEQGLPGGYDQTSLQGGQQYRGLPPPNTEVQTTYDQTQQ